MEDEHLRSLCFGDYMHPEAEKKIYDEIPDVTLLTKAMDHYLKVWIAYLPSVIMIQLIKMDHTIRTMLFNEFFTFRNIIRCPQLQCLS